jgi:uncharacterized protein YecE (DUF72 family)
VKLYLGTSQWVHENWAGGLYPENAGPKDFLYHYSKLFNCVELNPTFYNELDPKTVLSWKKKVSSLFKFCPKFPQAISHDRFFHNVDGITNKFLRSIKHFGSNLGNCFLQLPLNFNPRNLYLLEDFLTKIPDEFNVNVELRLDWLKSQTITGHALDALRQHRTGIVIVDSAETRPYLNKLKLTNDSAFVRFIGYNHPTDLERINEWIVLIGEWKEKGIRDVYFILHFPQKDNSPEIVLYSIDNFNKFFPEEIAGSAKIKPGSGL